MTGVSLVEGWLPIALLSFSARSAPDSCWPARNAGGGCTTCRRPRWCRGVVAWLLATFAAKDLVGEDLPFDVGIWLAVAVAAVLLAIGHFFRTPWWDKIVAVVAAILVTFMGVNQINRHYQQYPTLGDLLGRVRESDHRPAADRRPGDHPTTPSGPLTEVWTPTGGNIPTDGGKTSQISLPGTKSGFQAREGWVYYPPAYFADNAAAAARADPDHGPAGRSRGLVPGQPNAR